MNRTERICLHQAPKRSNHFSANGTVTFPFCLTNGGHPSLLYRWRDAYRKEGATGLRPIGRPEWSLEKKAKKAEDRITELECKIGQQAMVIDFLRRAFRRVGELRQPSKGDGGTASMERSKP